jgi:polysaccharide biosynthesis/export protein
LILIKIKNAIFAQPEMKLYLLFLLCFFSFVAQAQPTNSGQNVYKNPYTNPWGNNSIGGDKKSKDKKEVENAKKTKDEKKGNNENQLNDGNDKPKDLDINKKDKENSEKNEIEGDLNSDANLEESEEDKNGLEDNVRSPKAFIQKYTFNNIYGMNYFSTLSLQLDDKIITTPPMSYRIGSGDELIISIWGPSQTQSRYTVGNDGSIFASYVGKIYVKGLSFNSARDLIINKFRSKVAAGSSIDMQIGKSRTIRVTVMGEVKSPGTISINSFNTAINAIGYAGGPTDLANLRNIEIRRNGNIINVIDFYEFLKKGGTLDDQYLSDGDIIYIGLYEKLVVANGSFKRPMKYLMKEEETLSDLIELAGGPLYNARASNIQIKSVKDEQPFLLTLNMKELNALEKTYLLADGDEVAINRINEIYANTVTLVGGVNYPETYQIIDGERVLDVIRKAGGLEDPNAKNNAYIYRGKQGSLSSNAIRIELDNLQENDSTNITIMQGDYISIISKENLKNTFDIDVYGSVKKEGRISYRAGMKLRDIIILSGGLKPDAESGRIEIASKISKASDYSIDVNTNTIIRSVRINPNLELDDTTDNIEIKPYDKIYIRKKTEFSLLNSINILGELKFPGEYALINKNETISSLIKRSGGFTEYAFKEGLIVSRIGVKNNLIVDIEKALENPNSIEDLILAEGDNIFVPTLNNVINVEGQVQYPISIIASSDTLTVQELVDAAGGFAEDPWKKRISVRYPNGKLKSTKNFLFFKVYPKVKPGSTVFVPKKPEPKEIKFDFLKTVFNSAIGLTAVSSTLATTYLIFKKD